VSAKNIHTDVCVARKKVLDKFDQSQINY